jgi:hypothetical protein
MLDDDVARDLALFAGLVWGDGDRGLLAPLIDATIVWADEAQLDAIAAPIVEVLWADGLRDDIARALSQRPEREAGLADLALGPAQSRLALAYVKQGAVDLADDAMRPGFCLCCFEDGLDLAPPEQHERIALDAAVGIVLRSFPDFGADVPTDAGRSAARERVREIAQLAEQSFPRLSAALLEVDDDELWPAVRAERRAAIAAWN